MYRVIVMAKVLAETTRSHAFGLGISSWWITSQTWGTPDACKLIYGGRTDMLMMVLVRVQGRLQLWVAEYAMVET
jgi:hypothetical protein